MVFKLLEQGGGIMNLIVGRLIVHQTFSDPTKAFLTVYTVEIPKPPKPYIVLEVVKKSDNNNKGKLFHFVTLAEKSKVNLGRRKDIDVRVSEDISVSRSHASI